MTNTIFPKPPTNTGGKSGGAMSPPNGGKSGGAMSPPYVGGDMQRPMGGSMQPPMGGDRGKSGGRMPDPRYQRRRGLMPTPAAPVNRPMFSDEPYK